jgi:hypothetical protein
MAKLRKGIANGSKAGNRSKQARVTPSTDESSTSFRLAQKGVRTSREFAAVASALMCDAITNMVPPQRVNAACNAAGKLLKVVEMELKYGKKVANGTAPLMLTTEAR